MKMHKLKKTILSLLLCTVILSTNISVFGAGPTDPSIFTTDTETAGSSEEELKMDTDNGERQQGSEQGSQSQLPVTEGKNGDTSIEIEDKSPNGEETSSAPEGPGQKDTDAADGNEHTIETVPPSENADIPDPDPKADEAQDEEWMKRKEEVMDLIAGPEGEIFEMETNPAPAAKYLRSANHSSSLPVTNERYDKFYTDVGTGSASYPQLGMGIKYIKNDNQTPDMDGKWRYVYCTEFKKSSPVDHVMNYTGSWANKKVSYALYYGAMFWGEPCRWSGYSTGDWRLDYFVTQVAIHILNGEFTYNAAANAINDASEATATEKALAKDRINKIVNDANDSSNYTSFTSDGWFDASASASFTVSDPSNFASVSGGYATGYSTPALKTVYDMDMKEQIKSLTVSAPGSTVQNKDNKTYSAFRLFVTSDQYKSYQLTGKTITAKATVTAPRYWGGAIYSPSSNPTYQNIVLWSYTTAAGNFTKTASFSKSIPKKKFSLNIKKQDAETKAALKGATFSLWSYNGTTYNKKLGNFKDNGDGTYTYSGIDYTTTKDGWFLIKEDKAPAGYSNKYVLQNSADTTNYDKHGGREIQLTADGFTYDGVPNATIFKDSSLTPEAIIRVMKVDADTGASLTGAEFKVYEWSKADKAYKIKELQTLIYDARLKVYQTKTPVVKTEDNEGKFKVLETKLPNGYKCPWSKEITVTKDGTQTLSYEAPNYHTRNLTINKKIKADEITWAHGNPTFLFTVQGEDINGVSHTYHRSVEFTEDYVTKHSTNGYVTLGTTIADIPAGNYKIYEEGSILRYILTDATAQTNNITVTKKNLETINGFVKIDADVSADLTAEDGEMTFENHKTHYDKLSHNSMVVNTIK